MFRQCSAFIALFLLMPLQESAPASDVEVTNLRRAFRNGEDNAFTDLVRWKGRFWRTFRTCPDGHMVYPTSSILILSSEDAQEWREEHRFSVKHRDVRDLHFLIFEEQLFVYTDTWWSGEGELPREQYDLNKHPGYAASSHGIQAMKRTNTAKRSRPFISPNWSGRNTKQRTPCPNLLSLLP